MPIQGIPKFDGIALMQIEAIDFRANSPVIVAHGAFVSTTSGHTYGRTQCRQFSKETMVKLRELREAIEQDLADLVFETSTGPADTSRHSADQESGIGEFLSATEADPA